MAQQINIMAKNTAKYSVEIDMGDELEPVRFGFDSKSYWVEAEIDHFDELQIDTGGFDLPIKGCVEGEANGLLYLIYPVTEKPSVWHMTVTPEPDSGIFFTFDPKIFALRH